MSLHLKRTIFQLESFKYSRINKIKIAMPIISQCGTNIYIKLTIG